jgi:hypothetical protein
MRGVNSRTEHSPRTRKQPAPATFASDSCAACLAPTRPAPGGAQVEPIASGAPSFGAGLDYFVIEKSHTERHRTAAIPFASHRH